ncbi:MAG: BrnT family toxin [Pseudomonadota bacterium]|nr:BrnT family toxin [Pseudomonadota bacterium]
MANKFEWDEAKAANHLAKHGVSFDEAILKFNDPEGVIVLAARPMDKEDRFKSIGRVSAFIYTVVFTYRGEVGRVISAPHPNPPEERRYGDHSLQT